MWFFSFLGLVSVLGTGEIVHGMRLGVASAILAGFEW